MRVTTDLAAIALWSCFLASLPSYADSSASAHLEGYRCEIFRDGGSAPEVPPTTIVLCQIAEGGDPIETGILRPFQSPTTTPTLDSLLNLLTILDNARREASLQRHGAVVPAPAP